MNIAFDLIALHRHFNLKFNLDYVEGDDEKDFNDPSATP